MASSKASPRHLPEAALEGSSAGREWARIYTAHPYRWAGIPILVGLAAAVAAVLKHHVFGYVVGVSVAGFGAFIECLNVADSIWRGLRRRRGAGSAGG